jgi:hypothetical protein
VLLGLLCRLPCYVFNLYVTISRLTSQRLLRILEDYWQNRIIFEQAIDTICERLKAIDLEAKDRIASGFLWPCVDLYYDEKLNVEASLELAAVAVIDCYAHEYFYMQAIPLKQIYTPNPCPIHAHRLGDFISVCNSGKVSTLSSSSSLTLSNPNSISSSSSNARSKLSSCRLFALDFRASPFDRRPWSERRPWTAALMPFSRGNSMSLSMALNPCGSVREKFRR